MFALNVLYLREDYFSKSIFLSSSLIGSNASKMLRKILDMIPFPAYDLEWWEEELYSVDKKNKLEPKALVMEPSLVCSLIPSHRSLVNACTALDSLLERFQFDVQFSVYYESYSFICPINCRPQSQSSRKYVWNQTCDFGDDIVIDEAVHIDRRLVSARNNHFKCMFVLWLMPSMISEKRFWINFSSNAMLRLCDGNLNILIE